MNNTEVAIETADDMQAASPGNTGNKSSPKEERSDKEIPDVDMEEHIPWSTIRKFISKKTPPVSRKDIRWNVPLLIRDVLKLNPGSGFLDVVSFRGVHFKTVTIYGQAARTGVRHSKDAILYTVDDGTEAIVVYYPSSLKRKNLEFLGIASRLQHELDIYKKNKTADRSAELIKNLEVMIARIKKQIYLPSENFKNGTKVSVIGVPYKSGNIDSVRIYAFEMIADDGVNRDKEIFFKDSVMHFYTTKFVPKEVS